jgi:DNA-binding CsgD family transcriptional regulator
LRQLPVYDLLKRGEDRFWAHVARGGANECWEWSGKRTAQGYGRFNYGAGGMWRAASRVTLELTIGRTLARGEFACHHCDNPPCCNPQHLYAGSPADNVRDKQARGRMTPRTSIKLSDSQIAAIRADSRTQAEIAAEYGVSRSYISMLKSGMRARRNLL